MEEALKLLHSTLLAHQRKTREHRARPLAEKGDARRYPLWTLALDPQQPELQLEKPDGKP